MELYKEYAVFMAKYFNNELRTEMKKKKKTASDLSSLSIEDLVPIFKAFKTDKISHKQAVLMMNKLYFKDEI